MITSLNPLFRPEKKVEEKVVVPPKAAAVSKRGVMLDHNYCYPDTEVLAKRLDYAVQANAQLAKKLLRTQKKLSFKKRQYQNAKDSLTRLRKSSKLKAETPKLKETVITPALQQILQRCRPIAMHRWV